MTIHWRNDSEVMIDKSLITDNEERMRELSFREHEEMKANPPTLEDVVLNKIGIMDELPEGEVIELEHDEAEALGITEKSDDSLFIEELEDIESIQSLRAE